MEHTTPKPTPRPIVSHLQAGMAATVTFHGPENWHEETLPVTGTLQDFGSCLWIGRALIRNEAGQPGGGLMRVIDPAPPYSVGTRLQDEGDGNRVILTAYENGEGRWYVYTGPWAGEHVTDLDVEEWTKIGDDQ